MICPSPRSTLFPYTTLFRSQKDYHGALTELEALIRAVPTGEKVPDALLKIGLCQQSLGDGALAKRTWQRPIFSSASRSEEHTSELQSHSDLVCRLLLEKKNK